MTSQESPQELVQKSIIREKEYSTEHLKATVKESLGCQIEFIIDLAQPAVEAAWFRAVKSVGNQVSLPGFRKGKAPQRLIVDKYSSYVEQDWKELLLNTSFRDLARLAKWRVLSQQSIKTNFIETPSRESAAKISISFEAHPQLPEIEVSTFSLKNVSLRKVTQAKIKEAIEALREQKAEWTPLEGKVVEEGDYVSVDIFSLEDGSALCEKEIFQVKEGEMGLWMRELLLGAKAGDELEGKSRVDADSDKKDDFIPTRCRIHLIKLLKKTLPELDEAFFKAFSVSTLEELKEKIEKNLEKEAIALQAKSRREQVEQWLSTLEEFDLPKSMLESEMQHKSYELLHKRNQGKAEKDKQTELSGEEKTAVMADVRKYFRSFFLIRKLSSLLNIKVEASDMESLRQMPWFQNLGAQHAGDFESRFGLECLRYKVAEAIVQQTLTKASQKVKEKKLDASSAKK